MLFAASESAGAKKPRVGFTMRRLSAVRPFGSFHRAMSRFMFTSWGIQWLAHPLRYLSHAHLYLNGTSWFTSVFALMTRLSSARTRTWRSSVGEGRSAAGEGAALFGVGVSETFTVSKRREGAAAGVSSS